MVWYSAHKIPPGVNGTSFICSRALQKIARGMNENVKGFAVFVRRGVFY